MNMVVAAAQSAARLVDLVLDALPGFRDEAPYHASDGSETRVIALYKRAQILVADVWAAYGREMEGDSPCAFRDIGVLTMFADYRVPQLLRPMGVLVYSPDLARRIDAQEEVEAGSAEEVEIRALTVAAVEELRLRLSRAGVAPEGRTRELFSVELDWLLWQMGERRKDDLPPHHRTRTTFY